MTLVTTDEVVDNPEHTIGGTPIDNYDQVKKYNRVINYLRR